MKKQAKNNEDTYCNQSSPELPLNFPQNNLKCPSKENFDVTNVSSWMLKSPLKSVPIQDFFYLHKLINSEATLLRCAHKQYQQWGEGMIIAVVIVI